MTLRWLWTAPAVLVVGVVALTAWPGHRSPTRHVFPDVGNEHRSIKVTPEVRADALRRARVWLTPDARPKQTLTATADRDGTFAHDPIECLFVPEAAHGTTTKFTCVLASGEPIKVKYGFTREKQAEVAASRLLTFLGFLSDDMFRVAEVRCYGCPLRPFEQAWAAGRLHIDPLLRRNADRYVGFTKVAVERRHRARAIETETQEGWAWHELADFAPADPAMRAERDALRLTAMLIGHWDNKAENQRLVCLDSGDMSTPCERPFAMIHDLGSTFGPLKADLRAWSSTPVWADQQSCMVSMRRLPYGGGTFPDSRIGEPGRRLLVQELDRISRSDAKAWFASAGFDAADKWADVFARKVDEIRAARCE